MTECSRPPKRVGTPAIAQGEKGKETGRNVDAVDRSGTDVSRAVNAGPGLRPHVSTRKKTGALQGERGKKNGSARPASHRQEFASGKAIKGNFTGNFQRSPLIGLGEKWALLQFSDF